MDKQENISDKWPISIGGLNFFKTGVFQASRRFPRTRAELVVYKRKNFSGGKRNRQGKRS